MASKRSRFNRQAEIERCHQLMKFYLTRGMRVRAAAVLIHIQRIIRIELLAYSKWWLKEIEVHADAINKEFYEGLFFDRAGDLYGIARLGDDELDRDYRNRIMKYISRKPI